MVSGQKELYTFMDTDYAFSAGLVQPRYTDCGTLDMPKSVYWLPEQLLMEAPAARSFRLAGMRGRSDLAVVSSSGKGRGVGACLAPNLSGWRQSLLQY